ncbi:hypothetical protein KBP30_39545 [Streptomyces sp. Go40/10]|uniref:hypothetical protein n=1 Tax=Streptomyces sp. Go40/10 TaxID=2825844 RepID=UPI001E4068BE|nr:hypothetical protein [Streptomyces sp. Go40/10]UFR06899.1 hypothetical protein KBP30_39545 [Streptomyces sp. Go40/10]
MDTALLGVVCGAAGTVAGAAVAYFGPLQLERRRERREREVRTEDRAAADIARYVNARTAADQWLDLLRRAYQAALENRLDLARFDDDVVRSSDELRLRLTELAHLGLIESNTNPAFIAFRRTAVEIRRLAADGDRADSDDRGSEVLRSLEACAAERTDWARCVLRRLSARTGLDLSF